MAKLVSADLTDNVELCILYYETTNEECLHIWPNTFDAKIISHTYDKVGTIIFEKPITHIGQRAFYQRINLKGIWIPNSVTSIGKWAFEYCPALESVHISNLSAWCRIDFEDMFSNPLYYADNLYLNGELVAELTIPSDITQINNYTFYGCNCLTNITIPNSVTTIGYEAFRDCFNLTRVTIHDSVTTIKDGAFSGCYNLIEFNSRLASKDGRCLIIDGMLNSFAPAGLTEYIIPDTVTAIGQWTFYKSSSLTRIAIPDSVISIGAFAFSECSGELIINSKVVETDYDLLESAGYRTRRIKEHYWLSGANFSHIIIGDNIQKIGNNAFWGCSTLTSITIPNSVNKIGVDIFCDSCLGISIHISDLSSWCNINFAHNEEHVYLYKKLYLKGEFLTQITIPSDITRIKSMSFDGLRDITSITLPDSVTTIEKNAFVGCHKLTSVYYNGELSSWCKINFGGYLLNPLFANKTNLYINNQELTEIVIPANVAKINPYAFYNFNCLTRVTIHNGVTSIGDSAFYNCSNLTDIIIPDSVTSIGQEAFRNCSGLTSVTIPNSVTSIGDSAFYNCIGLINVSIGNGIASIGNYAFYGCSVLSNLILSNNIVDFGKDALKECRSLNSITVSDTIIEALMDALGKNNVTNLYVNITDLAKYCESKKKRVSSLYTHLLINNKEVTELHIPDGVSKIEDNAFAACNSLIKISIPNSVTEIGQSAFSGCSSLTSITIPNKVTSIGKETFCNCESLTKVSIPDSVTLIGNNAFFNCKLLFYLTIGKNVREIGEGAFWSTNIDTIISRATVPPKLHETYISECYEWKLDSFQQFETLVVPTGCEEAYSNSDWGRYIREETSRYDQEEAEFDAREFEKFVERERMLEELEYSGSKDSYWDSPEYDSYLALGGDPEKYRKGCLDNFMDSQGF